jgi:aminoglycoside phosphotransferase (APT) family kinase protein
MPTRKPSLEELRPALRSVAPDLAGGKIEYMSDGWDFWVFRAANSVLRVPKDPEYAARLAAEQRFLRELAPMLPLPIPMPRHLIQDGPNGLPFAVYQRIPGVPLIDLTRSPAPGFGSSLGRFLKALHAFPVERAAALGLEAFDGPRARARRIEKYEEFVRRVFPLLSCEARTYVEGIFERHLNDGEQWAFEPRLCHGDIDDRNVLADPDTGELTGVVDFTDADVHNPAGDFAWAYAGGFARLGIEDQLPELLREGGIGADRLEGYRNFLPAWFALGDLLHGVQIGDEGYVEDGIRALNAVVPPGLKCA